MADYSGLAQAEGAQKWHVELELFKDAVETDMTDAETDIAGKAPAATQTEVVAARGSMGSLDARIDVALNEDGSLKSTAAPATWVEITDSLTRIDDDTFTISGVDFTSILVFGRGIRLTIGGSNVYSRVKNSTFSTDTTVNLLEAVVTGAITDGVYSSVSGQSASFLWADIDNEQGITSIAYTNDLPTTITYDTGHKVVITYNVDDLPDVAKFYGQDGITFDHKFTFAYNVDDLCTSVTKSEVE